MGSMLVPCLVNWRAIIPYALDLRFNIYIAFIFLCIASTVWSIYPLMTLVSAAGLLIYVMFGCLLANTFPTQTLVLAIVWMLAAYLLGNWIWTAIDPDTGLLDPEGSIGALLRLQGMSGHPNFLGDQAAMFLRLVLVAYGQRYINRLWFTLMSTIGAVTFFATQSRTAALSLILSYVACRYRRAFLFTIIICLSILILMVITGTLNELNSLFVRQGDGDSLAGRLDIWDYLGPKIVDRHWFGYGFNIFEKYYEYDHPNLLNPMSPLFGTQIPSHPHNAYLEVLFSGGLITLTPYLVWSGLISWRWYIRPDLSRDLLMLWLMFGSMTEITMAGPPSLETLLCFIVLGMDRRRVINDD